MSEKNVLNRRHISVVFRDDCEPDNKYLLEAESWIKSMTLEEDNEDGPEFWAFLEKHHQSRQINPNPEGLYTTLFLVHNKTDEVIATGSLTDDDQDLGKKFQIEGPWIAGFNVRRDWRGYAGKVLHDVVEQYIQRIVDKTHRSIRLNLFTYQRVAEIIAHLHNPKYLDAGYQETGIEVPPQYGVDTEGKPQVICYRIFVPR